MLKIETDLVGNRVVERKGNSVHVRYLDNKFECWIDYDEKGNEIHHKNSTGYERWIDYDEKGNEIHYKNSDGYERCSDYDEYGEAIWCIDNKGGN